MSDNNYGSRDVHFGLTAEIGPNENVEKVQQDLFEQCHQMVMEQYGRNEKVEPPQGEPDEFLIKPFNWKNTQNGERYLEAKAEDNEEHGSENGPRGSNFEAGESVSGQQ